LQAVVQASSSNTWTVSSTKVSFTYIDPGPTCQTARIIVPEFPSISTSVHVKLTSLPQPLWYDSYSGSGTK